MFLYLANGKKHGKFRVPFHSVVQRNMEISIRTTEWKRKWKFRQHSGMEDGNFHVPRREGASPR